MHVIILKMHYPTHHCITYCAKYDIFRHLVVFLFFYIPHWVVDICYSQISWDETWMYIKKSSFRSNLMLFMFWCSDCLTSFQSGVSCGECVCFSLKPLCCQSWVTIKLFFVICGWLESLMIMYFIRGCNGWILWDLCCPVPFCSLLGMTHLFRSSLPNLIKLLIYLVVYKIWLWR